MTKSRPNQKPAGSILQTPDGLRLRESNPQPYLIILLATGQGDSEPFGV